VPVNFIDEEESEVQAMQQDDRENRKDERKQIHPKFHFFFVVLN
jgi:hypothetical protein